MLVFILMPVMELYIIIKAGGYIGLGPTLFLIVFTGVTGGYMARSQGMSLIYRIKNELENGRMPTDELIDGFMVLAGGLLLLTPGFITDFAGFVLLLPKARKIIKKLVKEEMKKKIKAPDVIDVRIIE